MEIKDSKLLNNEQQKQSYRYHDNRFQDIHCYNNNNNKKSGMAQK